MSSDGSIRLFFCDGEYDFCLRINELITLQEKTDCGPARLLGRISTGDWYIGDLTETIRLGLVGAGMDQASAHKLVVQNVRSGHLATHIPLAYKIIGAALTGATDDPVGEQTGEEMTSPTPTEESNGQMSSSSEAPQASRRNKSKK